MKTIGYLMVFILLKLLTLLGSYARVTAVHKYSADIQIWDKKITTVALTDLQPLKDGMVDIKTSLHESYYSRLMEKFGSIDAVLMSAIGEAGTQGAIGDSTDCRRSIEKTK